MSAAQEDYLLRMLRDAALFIRRVFDANKRGAREEASYILDDAWTQLLGLPRTVGQRLDAASLARILATAERCTVAADLLETEANLCEQDGKNEIAATLRQTAAAIKLNNRASS